MDKLLADYKRPKHNKDTKRWCKGKVGVEHNGIWLNCMLVTGALNTPDLQKVISEGWRSSFEVLVCKNCGKHIKLRRIT